MTDDPLFPHCDAAPPGWLVFDCESIPDGKKSSTNLHILMNWQNQGGEWKLLSRGSTKL